MTSRISKIKPYTNDINGYQLDNSLMFDILSVSTAGSIASFDWIGKGDEKSADQAAVHAMRLALNQLSIDATVVIGEGERDKAPMLYIGEKVGTGSGPRIDIALDPLEGTTICAHAASGAMSVIAFATEGGLLHAPDVYMDKIAVGPNLPEGVIDLDNTPKQNLQNIAKAKNCSISDLVVNILKRERHQELIAKVREAGARIQLINDGDIASVIATAMEHTNIDVYMGIGGAPEGVLAAAALRAIGGQMMGKLIFSNEDEKMRAKTMGITDTERKYDLKDLAPGNVIFAATGVTNGDLLTGVIKTPNTIFTNSLITCSKDNSMHYITSNTNVSV